MSLSECIKPDNDRVYFQLTDDMDQEERMREAELGSHTVRSHGITVARIHLHDWLILLLLGVIYYVLNTISPFYRFVGKDMMSDLKYPLKDNTVPPWAVPIYAVIFPILIFLGVYLRRKDVYDLHHATLGLLFSVLITAVLTNAIKDAVGRPRPDFFWRCFPDGKDAYDLIGNVICHGNKHVIKEGHKSFPSGHTSASFAGLGFLSLYLSGKIKVFDRRGHVAKLCISFTPLLVASLVGVSRVDDYWHHWQDVVVGGILGMVLATFCYLQFYPPPYHVEGSGSYAYSKMREESRSRNRSVNSVVAQNENENEVSGNTQVEDDHHHNFLGMGLSGNPSLAVDDLEQGRRNSQPLHIDGGQEIQNR
ncbi:lipid phosphate phosphatase 2-like isoform X2 [Impatiens glandulifera]|uniref:lipid phosphate phosphatase 2-like isoform X2 n=1 Tax=Impatiens glandulifera TaxID=253017 RepID=UPI001FB08923|nr:lipid phosphate phosphatase 2-like isoform X2 [Impatiens glandulifera]